ncbi:MAG: CoA-binding protein [Puia sp.]
MEDFERIPEKICTILLVDWPNPDIPRSLVLAGFTVFSYSPDGYNQVLTEMTQTGKRPLVHFKPVDHPLNSVDLVTIYRPPEEHAAIIRDHVLPLGAKTIWLQTPVESAETRKIAHEQGLNFIEGRDIREII